MSKLYVLINGEYHALDAPQFGQQKPTKTVTVKKAVETYIKNCTSNKCDKNQASEKLYFHKLEDFLTKNDIQYIDQVTSVIIQEFESQLLKLMKTSSCNRRFNTFKHFFAKCLTWKYISENPCLGMEKRREEENPHIPWPIDVFNKFILKTDGIYTSIFKFFWITGCRPMEAKTLKWTDIGLEEIILKCGKNAKVSRKVPLTEELKDLFRNIKKDSFYVFSKDGEQIGNDKLYHYCICRLRVIGEEQYSCYGLRHAFGSQLSNQGANSFEIAELMGHSKMETTRRYIHNDKKKMLKILKTKHQIQNVLTSKKA